MAIKVIIVLRITLPPAISGLKSCNGPKNPPILTVENINQVELARVVRSLRKPGKGHEDDDSESDGTYGFIPEDIKAVENVTLDPWKAKDADKLFRLHPDRAGHLYRDRVLSLESYPWNTIGRVFFRRSKEDRGGWCTASLVGKNLLLTASHCFPWGQGAERSMWFSPGYNNKTEPYGGSYVSQCRGINNTFNVTGVDYIVCHLCEPLGEKTGWMGTHWWRDNLPYFDGEWRSSGYPIDSFRGQAQMLMSTVNLTDIEDHGREGKELETNVFASPGWSGGPLWGYIDGEAKIVGVCSGKEKDCSEHVPGCVETGNSYTYHDVSAGGKLMTDLVRYGLAHWAD
ncbi:hypothetical protein FQN54_008952 [Arachnomyces sp. PD_36]|nr:hypothetical protein FQN54_008952 [Arachnomyces sp. PD_36]